MKPNYIVSTASCSCGPVVLNMIHERRRVFVAAIDVATEQGAKSLETPGCRESRPSLRETWQERRGSQNRGGNLCLFHRGYANRRSAGGGGTAPIRMTQLYVRMRKYGSSSESGERIGSAPFAAPDVQMSCLRQGAYWR
jgi:hypothetical protein